MNALRPRCRRRRLPVRIAFTLTELLVVIAIIGIMASSVLFAMWGAMEMAREARTRTQIAKLHELLMTRWEGYQTRALRLDLTPAMRRNARVAAITRLNALRDLMRMEMPDRIEDVVDDPVDCSPTGTGVHLPIPSLLHEYRRRATSTWTAEFQDAECLYMIVASIRTPEGNGLDFLHEGEIGDLDGDGMPEILDAWGRPIAFIRWPAGFVAHPGPDFVRGTSDDLPSYSDLQLFTVDGDGYVLPEDRDPFDPLQLDRRAGVPIPAADGAGDGLYFFNFALYPLICSAGPDQDVHLVRYDFDPLDAARTPIAFRYYRDISNPYADPDNTDAILRNDPYSILPNSGRRLGEPFLESFGYADNIHNHAMGE